MVGWAWIRASVYEVMKLISIEFYAVPHIGSLVLDEHEFAPCNFIQQVSSHNITLAQSSSMEFADLDLYAI